MGHQYTLAELSAQFDLELRGDGTRPVTGMATLADAGPSELSFLANSRYREQLLSTRAAAVILSAEMLPDCPVDALLSNDPYVSFARIGALFESRSALEPGVHPSAWVHPGASIADSVSIAAHCSIDKDVQIEADCVIGPGSVLGPGCSLGRGTRLVARVTLVQDVRIGQRVLIHPGAVIGADGFGLAFDADHWIKVPQLGGVIIGDDCEIGANTTIDRGALNDTVLENDVRLDNQIQIAHNVHIGAHTAMAGCSAVAGSARIGRYCLVGGGAGILGHISLCDRVTVAAMSLVSQSITEPGEYASSMPVQPVRQWRRNAARFRQLDSMAERLRILEKDENT